MYIGTFQWKPTKVAGYYQRHQKPGILTELQHLKSKVSKEPLKKNEKKPAHDQHPPSTLFHCSLHTSLTALRYARTTH